MAANFSVANITDLTAPTGGYISETSVEESIEVAEVQDEAGDTVVAKPKKLVTETHTIKGKGDPEIAAVVAGAFTIDTAKIVEAKGDENNGEFPDFEIVAKKYSELA